MESMGTNLNLAFHPLANLFPLLEGQPFDELVADIAAHGVREPVWMLDGMILDGRNRYRAAMQAGRDVPTRVYAGDDALGFVLSLNVHRRHLDESQRAMVAARLANLSDGQRPDRAASIDAPTTQAQAAELLNVSRPSVQRARTVLRFGAPELVSAVDSGVVAVSTAADLASLPVDKQAEIVARGATEAVIAAAQIRMPHVAHNSGENEWYTPPEHIEAARSAMGSIDVDPATSEVANRTVRAETWFTAEDDGLEKKWRGNVWLNPPYAQPLIARFSEAVSSKFENGEIEQACVLVNNATETAWFQRMLRTASAVCFPAGRVRFIDKDGNPGGAPLQGQAVLYMGPNVDAFAGEFMPFGKVLRT